MSLHLPALRGDDPLGFLAAVGLAALSEQEQIGPLRLGWSSGRAPTAIVDGYTDAADLVADLAAAFDGLAESDSVVPGGGREFPVASEGSGTDPMRMPPVEMRDWFARAAHRDSDGDVWFGRWVTATAAQTSVKDPKRGDTVLTPFYAPTGQMKLRRSLFELTADAVRAIDGPGDAVTGWVRTTYDGANFDDRATRDGGVTTSGKPANEGAPSPTWLATMAMVYFHIIERGRRTETVGWQAVRLYEGFTARSLVWPIWTPLLEPAAVRALLQHPQLTVRLVDGRPRLRNDRRLSHAGIVAVYGSSRRTLSQGDGPLGPALRIWTTR